MAAVRFPVGARRVLSKLNAYAAQEGIGRAGMAVLAHGAGAFGGRALATHRMDAYPDELFGVSTAGITAPEDLDLDPEIASHAVRYEATPPFELRHALARLPIDPRRYAFVDYGSGKGRVLLLAAEFPFARIEGVEAARSLHEIARANLAAVPATTAGSVASVCMDATAFRPPGAPLVAFMFNPFDGIVLAAVLDRIVAAAWAGGDEPSYLIYKNPKHRDVVERHGGFALVDSHFGESLLVYRARSSSVDVDADADADRGGAPIRPTGW